jgi:hypothetical protein
MVLFSGQKAIARSPTSIRLALSFGPVTCVSRTLLSPLAVRFSTRQSKSKEFTPRGPSFDTTNGVENGSAELSGTPSTTVILGRSERYELAKPSETTTSPNTRPVRWKPLFASPTGLCATLTCLGLVFSSDSILLVMLVFHSPFFLLTYSVTDPPRSIGFAEHKDAVERFGRSTANIKGFPKEPKYIS